MSLLPGLFSRTLYDHRFLKIFVCLTFRRLFSCFFLMKFMCVKNGAKLVATLRISAAISQHIFFLIIDSSTRWWDCKCQKNYKKGTMRMCKGWKWSHECGQSESLMNPACIHTLAVGSFTIISIYLLFRSMNSDKEENTISFVHCKRELFAREKLLLRHALLLFSLIHNGRDHFVYKRPCRRFLFFK